MNSEYRKTGLDYLGNISWGKHVCAFYETKEALLGILVPFFKAGLENNELCVWVLSEGLTVKDAIIELSSEIGDIEEFINTGQLKILGDVDIYNKAGRFNPGEVIQFWDKEESKALNQGFDGMRISGSGNFVKDGQWQALCDYEREVNKMIATKHILAICTYSRNIFGLPEILLLGVHHSVLVAKKENQFTSFESTALESMIKQLSTD
jgi:hypothetical protein